MKIKVSVPATSANIGSGFDALGLAVTLYNTVTFEESEVLDISSADGTRIPRGESNLVYRSAKGLFEKVGKQIPPLKITQTNPIPMARGLGSSSACIIAGLLGANRMLGDVLNTQELLTLATSIEGHPDNVAPALLGGLTSSVFEDGKVYSVKRNVDETLCFAAIVPDYKLLTEAARAALPKEVSHKDAVYNLSRAALVPAAFCEGRHDLLAIATEDKLHQPYRMPLMPGSTRLWELYTVRRATNPGPAVQTGTKPRYLVPGVRCHPRHDGWSTYAWQHSCPPYPLPCLRFSESLSAYRGRGNPDSTTWHSGAWTPPPALH